MECDLVGMGLAWREIAADDRPKVAAGQLVLMAPDVDWGPRERADLDSLRRFFKFLPVESGFVQITWLRDPKYNH